MWHFLPYVPEILTFINKNIKPPIFCWFFWFVQPLGVDKSTKNLRTNPMRSCCPACVFHCAGMRWWFPWRVLLTLPEHFFHYVKATVPNHRFLNTLDTTHSNIHQQQTGWNTPQGFMCYLSTNFETRYLLSSCSNQSIDKNFQFSPKFMLKVASSVFRDRCP